MRTPIVGLLFVNAAVLSACGEEPTPKPSPPASQVTALVARTCTVADTSIGRGGVRGDSALFAGTRLDWQTASHYGRYLRTMREPALCSDAGVERYRFLWLPSFQPAIAVRVERRSNAQTLVVKEVRGADYDKPGSLSRDTVLTLSPAEWDQFQRLLAASGFWDASPNRDLAAEAGHLDGAASIFEGAVPDRYHLVERWSAYTDLVPEPMHQVGAYLLKLVRYEPRFDVAR